MHPDHIIDERLGFLQIDQDTRTALAGFLPVVQRELPRILGQFYQHLTAQPQLAAMFENAAAMERAGKAQSEHWLKLFAGSFDQAYVASVRRIGLMHSRIGLAPQWYIGGYAFILSQLYAVAVRTHTSRLQPAVAQAKTAAVMRALNQSVMLDMDLAISIYLEENQAAYDRKLAGLADRFNARIGPLVGHVSADAVALNETAMTMTEAATAAARQMAAVTSGAHEASKNVNTIAAATEQLHMSVAEISNQLVRCSQITSEAVASADATNGTIQGLSDAAQRIGDVVSLINGIASQTNLLALNATIEAARAGEAGKGFAVVASEVKGLATQTGKATEGIVAQVTAMQAATQKAVQAIHGIGATIATISEITAAIASAVEQQSAATRGIAENIHAAADGTNLVSSNIGGVDQTVGATGAAATRVQAAAKNLQGQATALRVDVTSFLAEIRAA